MNLGMRSTAGDAMTANRAWLGELSSGCDDLSGTGGAQYTTKFPERK